MFPVGFFVVNFESSALYDSGHQSNNLSGRLLGLYFGVTDVEVVRVPGVDPVGVEIAEFGEYLSIEPIVGDDIGNVSGAGRALWDVVLVRQQCGEQPGDLLVVADFVKVVADHRLFHAGKEVFEVHADDDLSSNVLGSGEGTRASGDIGADMRAHRYFLKNIEKNRSLGELHTIFGALDMAPLTVRFGDPKDPVLLVPGSD